MEQPGAATPGDEAMIRKTRLAAAFAFGAGLTAASVGFAQTQAASAAPPAASAPSKPPSAPLPAGTLPSTTAPPAQPDSAPIKPWDQNTDQRVYSVDPPPDSSSGVYLPAAVLGYAKSAAGCVVIGCDDGPQAGGAAGSSSPASAQPLPPANPGSDQH
jgi:hypothetical protein